MEINISQNIVNQLLKVGKVSLPDIGSFTLDQLGSSIDQDRSTILAPQYELNYSEVVKEIDGLISSIASHNKVSFEMAKKGLSMYTEMLHTELEETGSTEIHRLGVLKDIDGSYTFNQSSDSVFSSLSYSLPPVKLQLIASDEEEKIAIIEEKLKKDATIKTVEIKKTLPTREDIKSENWFSASNLKDWLIAILLTSLLICCYNACGDMGNKPIASVQSTSADSLYNLENSEPKTISEINNGNNNNNVDKQVSSEDFDKTQIDVKTTKCIIITGSFKRSRLALKMKAKITAKGYEPFMERHGKYNRVGFSFDCEGIDLEVYLNRIRKEFNIYAWYLEPSITVPRK